MPTTSHIMYPFVTLDVHNANHNCPAYQTASRLPEYFSCTCHYAKVMMDCWLYAGSDMVSSMLIMIQTSIWCPTWSVHHLHHHCSIFIASVLVVAITTAPWLMGCCIVFPSQLSIASLLPPPWRHPHFPQQVWHTYISSVIFIRSYAILSLDNWHLPDW